MRKVEKNIRDMKSIRILFIFDFVIILILLISFFHLGFFSTVTYIFLPLLLICISLQLLLNFIPKGKIIFDASGVTIITKRMNANVCWDKIKCIYYNSFSQIFPLLNHFTLELWFKLDEEVVEFDKKFGNIRIFKDEYLNIISFIPRHILDVNDLMIYRNIMEKQKTNIKYRQLLSQEKLGEFTLG